MAAPRFVQAGTGAADATGDWTYTCPVAAAVGNVIIIHILQDGTTTSATSVSGGTNIENLFGTDNAWTKIRGPAIPSNVAGVGNPTAALHHIYIGRAINTSSAPTISGGNSTSEDLYIRSYEFANVSTGTVLTTVIENATAGATVDSVGTSSTAEAASVQTLGPDRLVLNFVAVNDDNAINQLLADNNALWLAVTPYAESSGTDGAIGLQLAYPGLFEVPAGTGIVPVYGSGGVSNEEQAQSFTLGSNKTATGLRVLLTKTGSPTDNLVVEIQTDNGGVPSGTVVGSGGTIAASGVSTTGSWHDVSLSASLSASTTYWVVLRRSGARDVSNYVGLNGGANTYSGGSSERGSGTWASATAVDRSMSLFAGNDGYTIAGASASIVDSDAWGVVGFALIGTTASGPTTHYGATTLTTTVAIAVAGTRKTFSATALITTATIAIAGARLVFGAFILPTTISIAVQGVRGVGGAFSLPVTVALSVSGTRKTFSAISLPITATTSVAGSRKTFSAFTLNTTVSITTDGHKYTNHFSSFSLPLTASISVAGNKTAYGVISLPTTAGISVVGSRKTFSSISLPVTSAITVQGLRETFSAIVLPTTVDIFVDGYIPAETIFGAFSLEITDTIFVAGARTTFSAISLPTTVDIFTKGLLGAFGAFSLPTTVSIDVNGTVVGMVYGAFSLETSAAISVIGKVTAFSEIALPVAVDISIAGFKETFGAFSLQEAISIYVDGQVEGKIYGAFSLETAAAISTVGRLGAKSSVILPVTVSISTAGARGVQGALSLATFVDIVTVGRVVKFGTISLPVTVGINTAGFLTAMGAFDLPTVFTIVTNGFRQGQEFTSLTGVITRRQEGALIEREDPLQGSSLESNRPSATIGP